MWGPHSRISGRGAARRSSWSTAVLPNHPTTAFEASVSFQFFFYLDDGTIGGSAEDIIRDLRIVEYEAGLAGLELNHAKTELYSL